MYRLVFTDWKDNLKKVSLARLFKERANMSLLESKRAVDGLLLGEEFFIELPRQSLINEIKKEATKLGAICKIVKVADSGERQLAS
jgi:hypothetical protein